MRRSLRVIARAALALLLAWPVAAWARKPSVRLIDPGREQRTAERIEARRGLLPAKYQRRNNFAWAICRIEGVDREEFIAHSSIQDINDIPADYEIPDGLVSFRPPAQSYHFQPQAVNGDNVVEGPDSWFRHIDTEFKILEDLARRIPSEDAVGRILLYTDLHPCASCYQVMCDFLDRYPNIQMQVLYREPYP